jgi:hypothetical protein
MALEIKGKLFPYLVCKSADICARTRIVRYESADKERAILKPCAQDSACSTYPELSRETE